MGSSKPKKTFSTLQNYHPQPIQFAKARCLMIALFGSDPDVEKPRQPMRARRTDVVRRNLSADNRLDPDVLAAKSWRRRGHPFQRCAPRPMAIASLWDRWTDPASGDEVLSATIIVSGASEWMTAYHDRMPVLLGVEDFDGWLNGTLGPEALKPAAEEALQEWIVSSRVNRTGHGDDYPTIVESMAEVG